MPQDALRFYPWDHLDVVRTLPDSRWFAQRYRYLSRTPTRAELLDANPPFGLLHDAVYDEEMQLQAFLQLRTARRAAQEAESRDLVLHQGRDQEDIVVPRPGRPCRDGFWSRRGSNPHG